MTNYLHEKKVGFFGLGESYFNGARRERMRQFTSLFVANVETSFDAKMKRFHRQVVDEYTSYIGGFVVSSRSIESYREYLKSGDFRKFEETALQCVFYLDRAQYEMVMDSDSPSSRFLYSSLIYKVCGSYLEYEVFGEKYLVSPKGCTLFTTLIPAEKQIQLNLLGIAQKSVPYSLREIISDGQMKIFVDLFKLVQDMDMVNQRILVVGSAAQSTGGSKSYDLLQWMFKDSRFDLYDPHDQNDAYVAANGNKYFRFAQAYTYGPGIVNFDAVQDDAFISFVGNRDKIDPDRFLFRARRFSCKRLDGDGKYFGAMKCNSIIPSACCFGCQSGEMCYIDKFHPQAKYGVAQVGRVATHEMRVMSHVGTLGTCRDFRFGTCAFCREMFYYCKKKYPDEFFRALAGIHASGSRCSLKGNFVAPKSDGNVNVKGRKFHVVNDVHDPVCMAYDPVLEYPTVTTFVASSKRTYVFSDVDNVQFYMFSARIAIYDSNLGKYYVNYLDEFICQSDDYDEVINGVRFRVIKDMPKGVRNFVLFKGSVDGYPIITRPVFEKGAYSLFLDVARYYGSFYLELGDKKYALV